MPNRYTVKSAPLLAALLFALPSTENYPTAATLPDPSDSTHNLVIVTVDGYRWQELFTGADPDLIRDPDIAGDTATLNLLYWHPKAEERRKLLMPFMWNVVSRKGQLWGNRQLGNKVNTANLYHVSYPGYNEIFTGTTDLLISSNSRRTNPNVNVLSWLNQQPGFEGKVAAFTSWDVFPYILNAEATGLPVNSGYTQLSKTATNYVADRLNHLQDLHADEKTATRQDQISFLAARDYLLSEKPRVLLIGLGETDEFAHKGNYGEYLQQANRIDRMLADLWTTLQSSPGYKDRTTLIITTDHGRGSRDAKWKSHSAFIRGSSQTWLAMIGPGIEPKGEMEEEAQVYQQELAGYMAKLLGEEF